LKAVHHIVPSSAEIIGGINTGFDNENLQRPARAKRDVLKMSGSTLCPATFV
jgi:hypothetical protein